MGWIAVMATVAVCPAVALAQPVFLDDFDGPDLLPHWDMFPPPDWEYEVSGGMLTVTRLLYPSHAKSPTNYATIGATFVPQTDFQVDVTMGWGEAVARFGMSLHIGYAFVASVGLCNRLCGLGPGIFAAADPSGLAIPAPPPGIYDLRIRRIGTRFDFYFDGELFASLPDDRRYPIDGVSFYFSSPYPGPSGPFHIDRVRVVAVCYADCDDSGSLDFFDFLCFQDAFAAGDGYADCDGSGSIDFFDFLCFQDAFAMGCP